MLYNFLSCQKLCDTYIFKIVHLLGGDFNIVSSFFVFVASITYVGFLFSSLEFVMPFESF